MAFPHNSRFNSPRRCGYVRSRRGEKKKNTKEVDLVDKLFTEIAPKYADRNGGYTRIIKIGQRKGDAAMEVILELV